MNRIFTFAIVSTLVSVGTSAMAFQSVVPNGRVPEQVGPHLPTRTLTLVSPVTQVEEVVSQVEGVVSPVEVPVAPQQANGLILTPQATVETVVQESAALVVPQSAPSSTFDIQKVEVAAPVATEADGLVVAVEPLVTESMPEVVISETGELAPAVKFLQADEVVTPSTMIKEYAIPTPTVVESAIKEGGGQVLPIDGHLPETAAIIVDSSIEPSIASHTSETIGTTQVAAPGSVSVGTTTTAVTANSTTATAATAATAGATATTTATTAGTAATAGRVTKAQPQKPTRVRTFAKKPQRQRQRKAAGAWWAFLPILLLPLLCLGWLSWRLLRRERAGAVKQRRSAGDSAKTAVSWDKPHSSPSTVQTHTQEIASAREPATTFESKRKSVSKVAVEANGATASAELTKATDASTSEKVEFVEIPVSDSNQDVAATQTVTTSKIVAAREQTTEVAQSATSAVAGTATISTVGKSTLVEDSVEVKNDAEVVQGGQESVRPQASRNPQKCGSKQDGSTSSTEILSRSSSDDLTKIHGIGPKTAELLRFSGITTFSALNEVPTARTEEILKTAGSKFSLIDSSRWQTQAGFAMNGDWDRLKQWQNDYCIAVSKSDANANSARNASTVVDASSSDNLIRIRGIGPATRAVLNAKGIHCFAQVAKMSPQQLSDLFADQQSRFQMQNTSSWPSQAQSFLRLRLSTEDAETELLDDVNEIRSIASGSISTGNSSSVSRLETEIK